MRTICAIVLAAVLSTASPAAVQSFQPGTFSIDGIPARCGNIPIILDTGISDVGLSGHGLIYLNPTYFEGLQTGLRLWWRAHECAHYVVGPDENAADCWSIRKGRDEGWFPPMERMFAHNPGDSEHVSGPERVHNMQSCYLT